MSPFNWVLSQVLWIMNYLTYVGAFLVKPRLPPVELEIDKNGITVAGCKIRFKTLRQRAFAPNARGRSRLARTIAVVVDGSK